MRKRTMLWNRLHLDMTLEVLVSSMQQHPTYTHRYKALHALFRSLADAALAEEAFQIQVEPTRHHRERNVRTDADYQRVVDMVRERRASERRKAC